MSSDNRIIRMMREYDISYPDAVRHSERVESYLSCFQTGYLKCLEDLSDEDVDLTEMGEDELMEHVNNHLRDWADEEFGGGGSDG